MEKISLNNSLHTFRDTSWIILPRLLLNKCTVFEKDTQLGYHSESVSINILTTTESKNRLL